MAHKQVLFGSAAREKILRGATQLADSVRVTLGPRSKAVLIEKKWGAPIVCNESESPSRKWRCKAAEKAFQQGIRRRMTKSAANNLRYIGVNHANGA